MFGSKHFVIYCALCARLDGRSRKLVRLFGKGKRHFIMKIRKD